MSISEMLVEEFLDDNAIEALEDRNYFSLYLNLLK